MNPLSLSLFLSSGYINAGYNCNRPVAFTAGYNCNQPVALIADYKCNQPVMLPVNTSKVLDFEVKTQKRKARVFGRRLADIGVGQEGYRQF